MKRLVVTLLFTCMFAFAANAQTGAQSIKQPCVSIEPFYTVAAVSGRQHMAISRLTVVAENPERLASMPACTDEAMSTCNDRGVEVKEDCEYRNEDGGTEFSSCRCQSIRYVKGCYQDAGCIYGVALILEISAECFTIQ